MAQITADENATAPATPAAAKSIIYPKADGLWYSKDDAGTETALSGAPLGAVYIVGATHASLTAERVITDSTSITWDTTIAGQVEVRRAALTGDVTASANANATTIAANAVLNTMIRDSGALSVIGRSANSAGDPADISATAATDAVLRESGSTVGFGTIATAGIADNAVSNTKIRDSGALSVIGRSANTTGDPADISATATSGAVLRESGSTLGFGTVATAGVADNAITYAKMQDIATTQRALGRNTAGAGDTEEVTLSQLLDWVGSAAQGDILYRNATVWTRLGAGTSGQVLTTNGAAANPSWAAAAGGTSPLNLMEGRLTLTTVTPVTTADVTAATTVFWSPYKGNRVQLFDGVSTWTVDTTAEISITVPATTNTMYDVFMYDNAGTPTLETTAWTNDTARATALVLQDGVLVKSGATTRRYLGSFRTTGVSGQTEDSVARRFVWNYYHRVLRPMRVLEAADTWTYTVALWRQANASTANQLDFVVGVAEVTLSVQVVALFRSDTAGNRAAVGIGIDTTSALTSGTVTVGPSAPVAGYRVPLTAALDVFPAVGRHYAAWLEQAVSPSGITTWEGDGGDPAALQSGIFGEIEG